MKHPIIFLGLLLLWPIFSNSQNYYPGGVPGAEAWYIINHFEMDNGINSNHGAKSIVISECNVLGNKSLFNFNEAVETNALCLTYTTLLENTTSRNVFFVGKPFDEDYNYSHLTTKWSTALESTFANDTIRNRFDLGTDNAFFNKKLSSYSADKNANVNFYHWNLYQADRKFKSYGSGMKGETDFYIGQYFYNTLTQAEPYRGNFPEFISFPYELTENQKNRVESYLALKYGLTLNASKSYRNARNNVFWNSRNNAKFGNRIFGIGRDDVSGLKQFQSHSEHEPGYLVTAVNEIVASNKIKQETAFIDNNNFIMYGDNGEGNELEGVNAHNVRPLKRKWLSQSTGTYYENINMHFRLDLAGEVATEISNGKKLWMLHDRHVSNQQISDYSSQDVEYYEADSLDGLNYGFFKDVFFDIDSNKYDQFTFGVGPEMIVQLRFLNLCDSSTLKANVEITGGTEPYNLSISGAGGFSLSDTTTHSTYGFSPYAPETYMVEVYDSLGNYATVTVEVPAAQINVDLGPDIVLTASQPAVDLIAYQPGNDSDATYKWYKNGELLDYNDSTMNVTQPGEYTVEVASANRSCIKTDTIIVSYNFTGTAQQIMDCNIPATIGVSIQGGIPPYTTVISGSGQTVYQVYATDYIAISDVGYGMQTVTTTDSTGTIFQAYVNVENLEAIQLDLAGQMAQICDPYYTGPGDGDWFLLTYPLFACDYQIEGSILDASTLLTGQNVAYEWYVDGQPQNLNTPVVQLYYNEIYELTDGMMEITVIATNIDSNCITSETIGVAKYFGVKQVGNLTARESNVSEENGTPKQEETQKNEAIITKVYPNPSAVGATFYYEVSSGETFDGTIEIFSPTGTMLRQETVAGQSGYKLSFELTTAGVYFICTRTNGKVITDKIIIK